MRGTVIKRGRKSWRLKFDLDRDQGGGRQTQYITVRGTRRQAEAELAKLLTAADGGTLVEPSKITVSAFVRERVDAWEAAGDISARTAQRYRQLAQHQIEPFLGAKVLQKLRPLDIEAWHTALRNGGRLRGDGGVAPRTARHAHALLGRVLRDAVRDELIARNVVKLESPPKVTDKEMVIIRDMPAFVEKLRGTSLRVPALLGALCGLRLGEVLGLRWNRIDLDQKTIQVRETLEQTEAHGIRFKPPKTKAGRRDVTMPDEVADALREYRREQLELRVRLGTGRLPHDALLFTDIDGEPRSLYAVSAAWRAFATKIGEPGVTFHGLRHSHASQLIDQGVDIVTISKRLGHAKPDITLRIYAHLFQKDDGRAAAAINAILKR
jgi:integrase